MNKHGYSQHHKIAQKYKNELAKPEEINCKENVELIKNTKHGHIHGLHGADTPVMIIMEDTKFNLSIFAKPFVKDIIDVLEKHFGHYYVIETHIQDELGKLFELENAFNHKK